MFELKHNIMERFQRSVSKRIEHTEIGRTAVKHTDSLL